MNAQTPSKDVRSVAELRTLRDAEIEALEAARAEIEELRTRRSAQIADATDAEIEKIDAVIATAERSRDRATARAERLESEIAVAAEAERQLELRRRYVQVEELAFRARHFQEKRYGELAAELAAGLALIRHADEAVAHLEVPDGFEKLPRPSDARRTEFFPSRTEIVRTTKWVDGNGVPTAVQFIDGQPTAAGVHQRIFEERREVPARGGQIAAPLYAAIIEGELPNENPSQPRYWPPIS